ncbi:MAG: hypothetical protein QXL43_00325 [Methanolinea sp.]
MRILTVGLGGAGTHIADRLLDHDRIAGAHCVDAVAVDCDAENLASLRAVPADCRLFFSPLDPEDQGSLTEHVPREEVLAHLQALDDGDIDALFVCCGLGGTLAHAVPGLVTFLKESLGEPVFAICTLPRREEGAERLARAVDQLEGILPATDGVIVFDNEAWKGRLPLQEQRGGKDTPSLPLPGKLVEKVLPRGEETPVDPFYEGIDSLIARRVTLLLRAGEWSTRDPEEIPDLVLDAGEILNTIQGAGLATLGYAREELPPARPLDHVLRFGPHTRSVKECHVKASRIVELAKRAVYDEISASTDLSRVKKGLLLIAGPRHEMSMKGFMTVRRWLDRSIPDLELRSGDYPVRDTRYIGVLVLLAGMDTLPRIEEMRREREGNPGP